MEEVLNCTIVDECVVGLLINNFCGIDMKFNLGHYCLRWWDLLEMAAQ